MIKDLCFEITQQCPNRCIFCSSNSGYDCKSEIPYTAFERVIDSLQRDYGIVEVSLSGGEPLLHPDIIRMIEKLNSYRIRSRLYTGGVMPSIERILWSEDSSLASIAKQLNQRTFRDVSLQKFVELKQAGLDIVVFSLHASEEDTYNKLMGTTGQYAHTLQSILNAQRADLTVEVHYAPMQLNKDEFEDVLELCDIAGIDTLSVLKFVPQGRACQHAEELVLSEN